jgi:hypothetical protein
MAHPLSALGAAAAASQLASLAFELVNSLSTMYTSFQDAVEIAWTRVAHLGQLHNTSGLIGETPPLQTPEI